MILLEFLIEKRGGQKGCEEEGSFNEIILIKEKSKIKKRGIIKITVNSRKSIK